jgi:hypothetical protein
MTWASRRQFIIIAALVVLIGGIAFSYVAPSIFVAPSCTDGKQNGDENGIDCGGSCATLCSNEAKDPVVLWSRAFNVTGSVYTAVAYIENQNAAALESLPYEFRLYDEKGVFVTRMQGTTTIPPTGRYAIVVPGIQAGTARITRTTIAFAKNHKPWTRVSDEVAAVRPKTISLSFTDADTIPKLSAVIKNPSITTTISHLEVAALVFDKDDNAIGASETVVQQMAPEASSSIVFTWPKPLPAEAVRYELLPLVNVFELQSK